MTGVGREERATLSSIIEAASRLSGLDVETIKGDARGKDVLHVRAAIVKVAWGRYSSPRIGRALGDRDHSTILNARDKYDLYCIRNKSLRAFTERLRAEAEGRRSDIPIPAPEPRNRAERQAAAKALMAAQETTGRARISTGMPKNNFAPDKGEPLDDGHAFHADIANCNDAFVERLKAARAGLW